MTSAPRPVGPTDQPSTFADLGVGPELVTVLERNGVRAPFPVQAATIPDLLAGRDVVGRAPTGSGKTLAFGLPLVTSVERARPKRPTALILAPTRELADQIAAELVPLTRAAERRILPVFGGINIDPQIKRLATGVDVLVATPGRLEDLIERRAADLGDVSIVVIDEADRMADMGFLPVVRRLLDQTMPDRQTVLFSATLDGAVGELVRDYQHDPAWHEVGEATPDIHAMEHHFWKLPRPQRIALCASVIATFGRTIVFTRTRHGADRACRQLNAHGVDAVAIHGDRSQAQRKRALEDFSSGRADALVATDVAARGIHVDAVGCVVHFDPVDEDSAYIHRSGRTARAGARGRVVSFVDPKQVRLVNAMTRRLGLDVEITEPPEFDAAPSPTPARRQPAGDKPRQRPAKKKPAAKKRATTKSGSARGGQARKKPQGKGKRPPQGRAKNTKRSRPPGRKKKRR